MRYARFLVLVVLVGCEPKKNEPPAPAPATPDTPIVEAPKTMGVGLKEKGTLGGMLKEKPFSPDAVVLEGKRLTFRTGKDFFADMELAFEVPSVEAKSWTFGGKFGHPAVNIAVKEGKDLPKVEFIWPDDYKMTLELKAKADGKVAGRIDFTATKPGGTRLTGDFVATVKRTGTDALGAEDAPYVHGKVDHAGGWPKAELWVGFATKDKDRTRSNGAGFRVGPEAGGHVTSTTFAPQLSTITTEGGPRYRHTRLTPGKHVVYAKKDNVLAAWKILEVKEGDQVELDLSIDPAKAGRVVVTLPPAKKGDSGDRTLRVKPAELSWLGDYEMMFHSVHAKQGEATATLDGLPAGKYTIHLDDASVEVDVVVGKESAVTLGKK